MEGGWGMWTRFYPAARGTIKWLHATILSSSNSPTKLQMTKIQSTNEESLLPSADSHEICVPRFDSRVKNGEDIDRPDFDKHSSRHNSAHRCFTLNPKVEIELCPANDSDEEG